MQADKPKLCIIHCARPDLTIRAVESIMGAGYRLNICVLDNSHGESDLEPRLLPEDVRMIYLPIPLTGPQAANWFNVRAEYPFWFYMHNDAEAAPRTMTALLDIVETLQASGERWGAALTNYDALAAFNVAAVKECGGWDWRSFPWYSADVDMWYKMMRAGYDIIETHLPVTHEVSGTRKADPALSHIMETFAPVEHRLLAEKIGYEIPADWYPDFFLGERRRIYGELESGG
jgi:hypothetical protein